MTGAHLRGWVQPWSVTLSEKPVLDCRPESLTRPILVTGTAGFIGFHVANRLLSQGYKVAGLDIVNDYYDPKLKWARLEKLADKPGWQFFREDLADREAMGRVFAEVQPQIVINLAAQAGVRYSLENPHVYVQSNLVGFVNLLEECRHGGVQHLLYASSSSVYGSNTMMPFSEHRGVDHPISLYAATKRANELMAHSYSSLYGLPTTGLRFFTVYGPWGRPDMALFLFIKAMLAGEAINVFNHGDMGRDLTYVDDVVEGIQRLMSNVPQANEGFDTNNPDPATAPCPFRVYNIGNNAPVSLMDLIGTLEKELGMEAKKNYLGMQPGDVARTWADSAQLMADVGYKPSTSVAEGVREFVAWYREYYHSPEAGGATP